MARKNIDRWFILLGFVHVATKLSILGKHWYHSLVLIEDWEAVMLCKNLSQSIPFRDIDFTLPFAVGYPGICLNRYFAESKGMPA